MELIDIIFNALIFSGVLLLIVILTSYLISRGNKYVNPQIEMVSKKINYPPPNIFNKEQSIQRIYPSQPLIFYVDQIKNREINIVKKNTYDERVLQGDLRPKNNSQHKKTKTNGRRYTIVNEQMRRDKSPYVIHF